MFGTQQTTTELPVPDVVSAPNFALVFHQVNKDVLVTRHHINEHEQLTIGTLIDNNELINTVMATNGTRAQLQAANVLVDDAHTLIWHVKRKVTDMWFRVHGAKAVNYRVEYPPLLFVASKQTRNLRVFALTANTRPVPSTRLFLAPLMNINSTGNLCQGSATLPDNIAQDTMNDIENTLYDSIFTHLNYQVKTVKGLASNDAHVMYWKHITKTNGRVRAGDMVFFKTLEQLLGEIA